MLVRLVFKLVMHVGSYIAWSTVFNQMGCYQAMKVLVLKTALTIHSSVKHKLVISFEILQPFSEQTLFQFFYRTFLVLYSYFCYGLY